MTDLGPTSIRLLVTFLAAKVFFCCQSAAILGHLFYHIGNFRPLFTRYVVGSVVDVGLLLRFPCFADLVCRPWGLSFCACLKVHKTLYSKYFIVKSGFGWVCVELTCLQ